MPYDPRAGDLFKALIEERHRVRHNEAMEAEERERLQRFLKTTANAGSYGLSAQVNALDLAEGKREPVEVYGPNGHFTCQVGIIESAGAYWFPFVSALVTGGARLILATLERLVAERGGSYALTDTDSMVIVANEAGGLVPCEGGPERLPDGRSAVRALSWEEVRGISRKLDALKPFGDAVRDPVLKIEGENFAEGHQRQLLGALHLGQALRGL